MNIGSFKSLNSAFALRNAMSNSPENPTALQPDTNLTSPPQGNQPQPTTYIRGLDASEMVDLVLKELHDKHLAQTQTIAGSCSTRHLQAKARQSDVHRGVRVSWAAAVCVDVAWLQRVLQQQRRVIRGFLASM
jgi:hypothetical protein